MSVPAVTCGAKITLTWGQGGGVYTADLSAVATNSPSTWLWTILYVPTGLEALLSGTWGDFVDGVSTAMNPSLPNIPTDTASGTIVIQCVATNGDGPSVPSTDKGAGQQCIEIGSELLNLIFPGDRQYNWGRVLENTLRKIEADTPWASCLEALASSNPLVAATWLPTTDTWYDATGLTLDITVEAGETVQLLFHGLAYRSGAGANAWVRFVVGGVVIHDPTTAVSIAASTVDYVSLSYPHTFAVGGTFTVKVQGKYNSIYGPWSLYDGSFQILRSRTP